ncbi:MAG: silent information regulator protein Sir2, partial [Spirochaetales bacterium]|nr:silent information regulator protein Sir2 [Spirochaetales bacterium]
MKSEIDKAKKIIVFTGAGVSTNSGLPDFRGEGGLYERVTEKYGLPYGEAIFDIGYFDRDPHPFFDLSKDL